MYNNSKHKNIRARIEYMLQVSNKRNKDQNWDTCHYSYEKVTALHKIQKTSISQGRSLPQVEIQANITNRRFLRNPLKVMYTNCVLLSFCHQANLNILHTKLDTSLKNKSHLLSSLHSTFCQIS